MGSPAENKVKSAALNSRDDDRTRLLVGVLIDLDTARFLPFAIDLYSREPGGFVELSKLLIGKMDNACQNTLDEYLRTAEGKRFITAMRIYDLINDNEQAMKQLRWLLHKRDLSVEGLKSLIPVLGNAAFRNNDPSALEDIRSYIHHDRRDVRFIATMTLYSIPGKEAEDLLVHTLKSSPDNYTEDTLNYILEQRKAAPVAVNRRAEGWRKESILEKKAKEE